MILNSKNAFKFSVLLAGLAVLFLFQANPVLSAADNQSPWGTKDYAPQPKPQGDFKPVQPGRTAIPQDACDVDHNGPAWTCLTGMPYPITLFEYKNPALVPGCGPPVYPFQVLGTVIELCNPSDFVCHFVAVPQIYEADLADPNCPVPGNLLCEGVPIEVGLPPTGGQCLPIEYWFEDTCCVYGPYFAAWNFIFIEPCGLGPCVDEVCDTCYSWQRDPTGMLWESCSSGFPGNWRISSWGLSELQNNCPGGLPLKNHFKTWRVEPSPLPVEIRVLVLDQFQHQFRDDTLSLADLEFLSNPVFKTTIEGDVYPIIRPDDHLNWYRTSGYTLIEVEYVNQFESTTVVIDSVAYLLVPAQKLEPIPHPPPESLDHYKCYRIQEPVALGKPLMLVDQFDQIMAQPELIDLIEQAYFCTPCQKNGEPVYDTITHYLAYHIMPPTLTQLPAVTIDQFGEHVTLAFQSEMLLAPTKKTRWISLCVAIPGDANASGTLTLADIIAAVNYVFNKPGWPPCPSASVLCWLSDLLCRGDWNASGNVTLADVIWGVNYIFNKPGGPWLPLPSGTCCQPVP